VTEEPTSEGINRADLNGSGQGTGASGTEPPKPWRPLESELRTILEEHQRWVESGGTAGRKEIWAEVTLQHLRQGDPIALGPVASATRFG
jgi:hypothetical protein